MNKLLLPKNAKQLFINGPVGKLDCLELTPETNIKGIAIIFHPDPKGGGTYTNKVIQTIAKILAQKSYICYCPNLRGVGMSDGIHDNGKSEIDDATYIYNHVRSSYPNLPLIIAGFSFGTLIASQLAKIVSYQKMILVGPAVTRYNISISDISKTIVIHGENDELIELHEVFKWAKSQNQPIVWFPNAGHFFHGKLIELQTLLNSLIN